MIAELILSGLIAHNEGNGHGHGHGHHNHGRGHSQHENTAVVLCINGHTVAALECEADGLVEAGALPGPCNHICPAPSEGEGEGYSEGEGEANEGGLEGEGEGLSSEGEGEAASEDPQGPLSPGDGTDSQGVLGGGANCIDGCSATGASGIFVSLLAILGLRRRKQ